jgi:hypothetical protein
MDNEIIKTGMNIPEKKEEKFILMSQGGAL